MSEAKLRNPLNDPMPGDWISGTGPSGITWDIRIDDVRSGRVYVAKFHEGATDAAALLSLTLDDYRAASLAAGARVDWRAEEGARP